MKIKRQYPTRKSLLKQVKATQQHVRHLAGLVDPPLKPEDYAVAAQTAQSIITQLDEADGKDGGRRSVLVPIMLYDAVLDGSLRALAAPAPKPEAKPAKQGNPFTQAMGTEGM